MSENERTDPRSGADDAGRTERTDSEGTHEERAADSENGSLNGSAGGGAPDVARESGNAAAFEAKPGSEEGAADRAVTDEKADASAEAPQTAAAKTKNELWEWVKALLIAFALAFLIRYFLFGSYIVDGPSMQPNFHTGERIIVNKILYDFRAPKRGEVIVFHATATKDYIKRVIALPGETIRVQGDTVFINGQPLDEPYLKEAIEKAKQAGRTYNDYNLPETKVPEGTVFVMGDNRSDSTDSRMIGPVTFDNVVGRAEIVFWPLTDLKYIH